MLKRKYQKSPFLYSVGGFHYCNLLLSQGKYQVVKTRVGQTIKGAKQNNLLLDLALDNLSLGRAYLFQAQAEKSNDFTKATDYLNHAIEGLRQAGDQEYITCGLLARVELYRARGDPWSAKHDLDEAMSLAEYGGMGLYQADCHLKYARLHLSMAEKNKARESLNLAKRMIEKMGYHLRDKDVKEIEGQL